MYTFYSDSHTELYNDFFLKSYNECGMDKSFTLFTVKVDQKSDSGDFNSPGFNETTIDKLIIIKNALEEIDDGERILYSDCDIQFFDNIYDDILSNCQNNDSDIICQHDQNTICTGFMVIKKSPNMINFINLMIDECPNHDNDQCCVNVHSNKIKYSFLPTDKYYTVGNYHGLWYGSDNIFVPPNLKMHHANFTLGVENKIKLMNLVKIKTRL
jgi:hypothetical protein